jgi:hypothetical protein
MNRNLHHSHSLTAWVTTLRLALGFYIYGATVIEVFVYYPSWPYITGGWEGFKQSIDRLIIPLYVVPAFLVFIPAVLMFWFRPVTIPRWAVWASLVLLLIPTISTLAIQLPIQLDLEKGFDLAAYYRLRSTDLVYRQIAAFLGVVLNVWMVLRLFKMEPQKG